MRAHARIPAVTKRSDTIEIEKLTTGGSGMGYYRGRPVFVPLSAPGDRVVPDALQESRGTLFIREARFHRLAEDRRQPPCPWFGRCGGCDWMHLPYPEQLRWKRLTLMETLGRIGKLTALPVAETVPSPEEFGWRHRIRVHVRRGRLGFFALRSHDLVEWDRCLIAADNINRLVKIMRQLMKAGDPAAAVSVEVSQSPVDGSVSLFWRVRDEAGEAAVARFMDRAIPAFQAESLTCIGFGTAMDRGRRSTLHGDALRFEVAGRTTYARPGTFTQVNPFVNRLMVERVAGILRDRGVRTVLDLYCGNGNLTLPAAGPGMTITGVDSSPGAIDDARAAGLSGADFKAGNVDRFCQAVGGDWDAVIVDPPRTGLSRTVRGPLGSWKIRTLVYVSCHPAALARDLGRLQEAGYALLSVEPLDMFPNSSHVETLSLLQGLE